MAPIIRQLQSIIMSLALHATGTPMRLFSANKQGRENHPACTNHTYNSHNNKSWKEHTYASRLD